jgi:hypothetical protein
VSVPSSETASSVVLQKADWREVMPAHLLKSRELVFESGEEEGPIRFIGMAESEGALSGSQQ